MLRQFRTFHNCCLLKKFKGREMKIMKFICFNFHFSQYDIIVTRRSEKNAPNRLPWSYTNADILNHVDDLYVAVRRLGAPKTDDIVTIGNGINNRRRRRNLASKCLYISKYEQYRLEKIYKFV